MPSKTSCKYYSVNDVYTLKNQKNLNIFHTNVNGLGSKLDNLKEFLSATTIKLDIIAITETSEKDETGFLTNVEIEGYDLYHTPTLSAKGGSAIYVNKNYDSLERYDLNIKDIEYETTWIEIKNKKSKNIVCGNVYRHPHYNCDDFFKYLESCLATLAKESKEVYICGDFNFDLLKVDTDHLTQHFFNLLCSYGFLPHILQPTRATEHTSTVIDNIFSNNIQDDITSGNVLLNLSDHFAQIVSVNREQIDTKKINMYRRDYSTFSSESFCDDVSIQNWCYTHDNVNESFKDFYYKLEGSVDRHAPFKKLTPKEINIKNKPWLSAEILKMIKVRNKTFERKIRQPGNENCRRLYNLLRNRVNREIKKSKKNYYADYFKEHVKDIKKTWEGIKKIVNLKKNSNRTTQLIIGGKIVANDKEIASNIASNFNNFFANVGVNTEKLIPKVPNIIPSKFLRNHNQLNFVIAHI